MDIAGARVGLFSSPIRLAIKSPEFSTSAITMRDPPKYVIDHPLGGPPVPYERVLGPDNSSSTNEPSEGDDQATDEVPKQIWPLVPFQFEPPPSHLEETIKEGRLNFLSSL